MKINVKNIKVDPTKLLTVGVAALSILTMVLNDKIETKNRKTMKEEIYKDLKKDLNIN